MSKPLKLSEREVQYLNDKKRSEKMSVRKFNRINILLLLHKGKKMAEIENFIDVDRSTIARVKKRYLEEGVEQAIEEKERPGQPVKYTVEHQAELAALACGPCPPGRKRWTVRLLTKELKSRPGFETINRESLRLALKKTHVSLG